MDPLQPIKENPLALQFSGFLKTPPLWLDTTDFNFPQFLLQEIKPPENIPDINIPPKLVLGKRIERFFRYYLEHYSEEEVLAENVQIISKKITLGELDFILENKQTKEISHIEVVYKFYLYDPEFENEVERWIGPNRKDSLSKKISRLQTQQFPLLYRNETQPLLKDLKITPEEVHQKVLFKANLFVPYPLLDKNLPLINNNCIRGFWIRSSEFTESSFGDFSFFSPKKPDWPVLPQHAQSWFSFSEIKEQLKIFLEKERSPLLWMKKSDNEYYRFFVVWW